MLRYSNYNTYTKRTLHATFIFFNITPAISALIFKCYPHSSKYERRETDSEEETGVISESEMGKIAIKRKCTGS